jgi:hypothetical protein
MQDVTWLVFVKTFWDVVPLVHHAAPVVFPVDFDGGEHVYRIHPINVQLVTDPIIMLAKDEHGCDSTFRFSDGRYRVYRRRGNVLRTNVCTSPTVLEAEVLWSGLEFVMMVALSSKLFKEY